MTDVAATTAGAVDDESDSGAEGDYASEAGDIKRQAREARAPEGGENLLEP